MKIVINQDNIILIDLFGDFLFAEIGSFHHFFCIPIKKMPCSIDMASWNKLSTLLRFSKKCYFINIIFFNCMLFPHCSFAKYIPLAKDVTLNCFW